MWKIFTHDFLSVEVENIELYNETQEILTKFSRKFSSEHFHV